ncbi:MAG: VOC family protein [Acidimicrobiia bacterium]
MFNVTALKYILMVQDMNRALEFYSKVFNLSIGFQSPDWSELVHGDAVVALHSGGTGQRVDTGLSFQVDDIDTAVAAVQAAGGTVVRGPTAPGDEGILLADLVDTEGNGFMLSQPIS